MICQTLNDNLTNCILKYLYMRYKAKLKQIINKMSDYRLLGAFGYRGRIRQRSNVLKINNCI